MTILARNADKGFAISAGAVRREHLFFQREQSLESRSKSWERRLPPLKSKLQWALHTFGVIGFFATVFLVCFFR